MGKVPRFSFFLSFFFFFFFFFVFFFFFCFFFFCTKTLTTNLEYRYRYTSCCSHFAHSAVYFLQNNCGNLFARGRLLSTNDLKSKKESVFIRPVVITASSGSTVSTDSRLSKSYDNGCLTFVVCSLCRQSIRSVSSTIVHW